MKKISILFLGILFILALPINIYASEYSNNEIGSNEFNNVKQEQTPEDFVLIINQLLALKGTDVEIELQKSIARYERMMQDADEETAIKLLALIDATEAIINDYQLYSESELNQNARGSFHVVYSAVVASAISYFELGGYDLAAELLTHARDNNVLDSYYTPVLKNDVMDSSVFSTVASSSGVSGSAAFPTSSSTDENDLYLAIHNFDYRKTSTGSVVVIEDRYDFEEGSMAGTIMDMAVNEMYNAQEAGVIVPYFSNIVIETGRTVAPNINKSIAIDTIEERRLWSERVLLGKSETIIYNCVFENEGKRLIQTFGTVDTKIHISDINGNILASNDDGGYSTNALLSYYFEADTIYYIKLELYAYSKVGETLLVMTPATGLVDGSVSQIDEYEDIHNETGRATFSYVTSTQHKKTKVITYTPQLQYDYEIEISSEYDTYIYVIDPRSSVPLRSGHEYDDDSGENMNPKVEKYLEANIPYLIIYSAYNLSSTDDTGGITISIKQPWTP